MSYFCKTNDSCKRGLAKNRQTKIHKLGGQPNANIADKGGRGFFHLLTVADRGGRVGKPNADNDKIMIKGGGSIPLKYD